jgi:hypothetical protein
MVRTMVQLTEEQARALKAMAKARKVSVARLVRESVSAYVATAAKDPEQMNKKRRALAGLQKIKQATFRDIAGKKDVSINHDKYLEEIYAS